jgi:hypothetical protein
MQVFVGLELDRNWSISVLDIQSVRTFVWPSLHSASPVQGHCDPKIVLLHLWYWDLWSTELGVYRSWYVKYIPCFSTLLLFTVRRYGMDGCKGANMARIISPTTIPATSVWLSMTPRQIGRYVRCFHEYWYWLLASIMVESWTDLESFPISLPHFHLPLLFLVPRGWKFTTTHVPLDSNPPTYPFLNQCCARGVYRKPHNGD